MNTSTLPKTPAIKIILFTAAVLFFAVVGRAEPVPQAQPETISVFLVDDQTGEELATKHGIQPIASADLEVLINAVLRGTTPIRLLHEAVDEDATDNVVAQMDFHPFLGKRPPTAPSPSLPLRQLAEAMKTYRKDRAVWQQEIIAYRRSIVSEVENFVKRVSATQLEVSQRFDRMLAARNGRDFNRSDILGCITTANSALGTHGRRFLILNTDADDLPAKRKPRKTALKPEELDPKIELVFVNTSRIPEHAPLFAGLPNPVHHCDSMRSAMELIANTIKSDGLEEASK